MQHTTMYVQSAWTRPPVHKQRDFMKRSNLLLAFTDLAYVAAGVPYEYPSERDFIAENVLREIFEPEDFVFNFAEAGASIRMRDNVMASPTVGCKSAGD